MSSAIINQTSQLNKFYLKLKQEFKIIYFDSLFVIL